MPVPIPQADLRELKAQFRAVDRALAHLEREEVREALSTAATRLLRTVVDDIRTRTPRRTGQLRRSAKVWAPKRPGDNLFDLSVGYRAPKPVLKAVGAEYGNRRFPRPAKALRSAWAKHRDDAVRAVAEGLRREVDRVRSELAAKLRRHQ